jgi:predicted metal-binding protein
MEIPVEVVGWMACGGCPGERLEFAPADMKKYGAEMIYLASCYLAGYPACPYIEDHKKYIENVVELPAIIGTHPMPQNYIEAHNNIGDWKRDNVEKYLKPLTQDQRASEKYDSTRSNYLKENKS